MANRKEWGLLVGFVLMVVLLPAQIVNIESRRMQTDSIRLASRNEIAGFFNDNNGLTIFNMGLSSTTQIKSRSLKDIFLVLGNFNLIFSEKVRFQQAGNFHLRYNREITQVWRVEAFTQYSDNQVLDVARRWIAGGGLRLKLVSSPGLNLYLGSSLFYEKESNPENAVFLSQWRHNLYLSFTARLAEQVELIQTSYFQLLFGTFSNYNVLSQLKFNAAFGKKGASFFVLLDYLEDSVSPLERRQYAFATRFGLGWNI